VIVMRNSFAEILSEAAARDPRIYVVVADISPAGPMAAFREQTPERFINVGVAEQSMIGVCAGLALRGMRPFAYTIATFALYRPFEFIRDDLAYQNLPVTVVGIGGGVVYSTLGGTHHAQEDVAVACAIPNMSVIAPCDSAETASATRYLTTREGGGPVYLRLGKAGEPDISSGALDAFEFGKVRHFRRGTGDIAVLSYGLMMHKANDVAAALEATGRSVTLVAVPTIKPLDIEGLTAILESHEHVVVMEEHAPQGGLASLTKQLAWDTRADCRLDTFTLKDEFIHCYGSHNDLLNAHGLSHEAILTKIARKSNKRTMSRRAAPN
jgi:transketolase